MSHYLKQIELTRRDTEHKHSLSNRNRKINKTGEFTKTFENQNGLKKCCLSLTSFSVFVKYDCSLTHVYSFERIWIDLCLQ